MLPCLQTADDLNPFCLAIHSRPHKDFDVNIPNFPLQRLHFLQLGALEEGV